MASTRKVGSHKTVITWDDNNNLSIQYHNTVVCKINFEDRTVIFNSGGYRTATTKRRINQAMNQFLGSNALNVYQQKRAWYVYKPNTNETIDFEDNMKVSF